MLYMDLKKNYLFYIIKNLNCFIIFSPIIFFKIINYENKYKSSRSNKLLCFKYFSKFKHFYLKNTQPNDFYFLILNKKIKKY